MEKFMGREEKEKKEKGGYGERLREITAVLKKHAITRGVSPETVSYTHLDVYKRQAGDYDNSSDMDDIKY